MITDRSARCHAARYLCIPVRFTLHLAARAPVVEQNQYTIRVTNKAE
ncbi:hypothetical protein Tco_0864176, partial [Tanacetum coccineum]